MRRGCTQARTAHDSDSYLIQADISVLRENRGPKMEAKRFSRFPIWFTLRMFPSRTKIDFRRSVLENLSFGAIKRAKPNMKKKKHCSGSAVSKRVKY
jgi:hypothetical protein